MSVTAGSHMNGLSLEALTNGGTSSNHSTSASALLDSMSTMSPGGGDHTDDGSMSLLQHHGENINLASAANNVMHATSPQMSNGDDEDMTEIRLEQTAGIPRHHHQSPAGGSAGGGSASNSPPPPMMMPATTISLSGRHQFHQIQSQFKAELNA